MKDGIDCKTILKFGYFRSLRNLGLEDPGVYLDCNKLKECALEAKEINKIRAVTKLRKEDILRCFELVLLACLHPTDARVHEAYR